jgi:hypothetical protein
MRPGRTILSPIGLDLGTCTPAAESSREMADIMRLLARVPFINEFELFETQIWQGPHR